MKNNTDLAWNYFMVYDIEKDADVPYKEDIKKLKKQNKTKEEALLKIIDLVKELDTPEKRYINALAYLSLGEKYAKEAIYYTKLYLDKGLSKKYIIDSDINLHYMIINLHLGSAYQNIGDLDTALKYYKKASIYQPNNSSPYLSISEIYKIKGDKEKAIQVLENANIDDDLITNQIEYLKQKDDEIFLSFKPYAFKPILYNIKKYEYRKRFSKRKVKAYLYLSSPIQKVVGIINFKHPLITKNLILKYDKNTKTYKRLKKFLDEGINYIVPIQTLTIFKEPVPIDKLKEIDKNFHIPQNYQYINNTKIQEYLKTKEMYDLEFYNKHDIIYDDLGKTVKELEKTKEYQQKDKENNQRYDLIKELYNKISS